MKKLIVFSTVAVIVVGLIFIEVSQAEISNDQCPDITHSLFLGLTDAGTGGDVSKLQRYLAQDEIIYPEGLITGYFGSLTKRAVEQWQCKYNIVCEGTPATTGYGVFGPKSKAGLSELCSSNSGAVLESTASSSDRSSTGYLDGQIIVDPNNPEWLVYNRDNNNDGKLDPFFMAGPGDPEMFLYLGTRNADGTRTGNQMAIINKLKNQGGNSIYLDAVRSHRTKQPGQFMDHNPFIDSDPNKGFDEDILNQWEEWFTAMDNAGIVIYFFFYDGGSHTLGTCDSTSILPKEKNFIETLVNRFEHHKHLIWVPREEFNGEPRIDCSNWNVTKVHNFAKVIRDADDHNHVIAAHQWPGSSHSGVDTETEFLLANDSYVDQFAMQLNYYDDIDVLYNKIVSAFSSASGRYQVNMSESCWDNSVGHAWVDFGKTMRDKAWASAMGGAYFMQLGWFIPDNLWDCPNKMGRSSCEPTTSDLADLRNLQNFMESTNFNEMSPANDLRHGNTNYVLANSGCSYIAYTRNQNIGLRDLKAGDYRLKWIDILSGRIHNQELVISGGDKNFTKPSGFGNEMALWIENKDQANCSSSSSEKVFIEAGGVVSMEAENFTTNYGYESTNASTIYHTSKDDKGVTKNYTMNARGFSGNGYMATDNTGIMMNYKINFTKIGTYLVNFRTIADLWNQGGGEQNGFCAKFDGDFVVGECYGFPPHKNGLNTAKWRQWDWVTRAQYEHVEPIPDFNHVKIEVRTPGIHTFSISPREPYSWIDKIVFQHESLCIINDKYSKGCLSGTGPAESRITGDVCTPSCTCATNTCIGITCSNGCGGTCSGTKNCTVPTTQSVLGFVLVNADTDRIISTLTNGATVDINSKNINITAITNPITVGSVKLYIDGVYKRTEIEVPYTVAGDVSGDYLPLNISSGFHTIRAVPYSGLNGSGTMGVSKQIGFTVGGNSSTATESVRVYINDSYIGSVYLDGFFQGFQGTGSGSPNPFSGGGLNKDFFPLVLGFGEHTVKFVLYSSAVSESDIIITMEELQKKLETHLFNGKSPEFIF